MKFSVNTLTVDKQQLDCIVVGVFENGELTPTAKQLDSYCKNYISECLMHGDFNGKLGITLLLSDLPNLPTKRLLLVGCGNPKNLKEKNYSQIIKSVISTLETTKYQSIGLFLTELAMSGRDIHWHVREAILSYFNATYKFEKYKSKNSEPSALKCIIFAATSAQDMATCEDAIHEATAIASGIELTKNLANLPCNDCTPTYLADESQRLAKQHSPLKVKIFDEKNLEKMGFGAFVAVSKGSAEAGKLIILEYKGGDKTTAPIALIGKGITFDSGGISLKPAASMLEMKFDMCGAATVLGVIKAIAELNLPINVVGALAAAENMPDGNAIKPEAIVKTLSGQTVEITNTDAEGRLVLCDTLTYIEQEYKPKVMIDIATLTGAMVMALGRVMPGFFTENETLAEQLKLAGKQASEPVWQLPMCEEYFEALESTTADMMNAALTREGGASIAACFLAKFVKETPWAHIDIAGVSNISGNKKSATGRTVPLLVQYLLNVTRQS